MPFIYKEINFAKMDDFIIFSDIAIRKLLTFVCKSRKKRMTFYTEEIFPVDYLRYVLGIINTNRGIENFRYEYIANPFINGQNLIIIVQKQLALLTMDGERCFLSVQVEYVAEQPVRYKVTSTYSFYRVCRDKWCKFLYLGKELQIGM